MPPDDPQDLESIRKKKYKELEDEIKRRKAKVGDEYRDEKDISEYRDKHRGEYNYGDISMFDMWQKTYCDKFGGILYSMDTGYRCKKCGTWMGMAIPPEYCPVCHTLTPMGEMYHKGFMFRR